MEKPLRTATLNNTRYCARAEIEEGTRLEYTKKNMIEEISSTLDAGV